MPFTFNINFTSSGKAPSRISCIKSGTSVPDDTLKYFKLFKAASPNLEEKYVISAGVAPGNFNNSQWLECIESERRLNCES